VVADLLKPANIEKCLQGCDLILDCVGFPPELMDKHPVAAANIANAIKGATVRCVQVSSYGSYLPIRNLPLSETHPRTDGSEWMKFRREAENIMQRAGAAVIHLPDFFGPFVHTSTLQNAVREAVGGSSKVNWIGKRDVERDYIFVPDAAKIITRMILLPGTYGARWILKGSGPLTGEAFRLILGSLLDRPIGLRCAGTAMLRVVSLFKRDLRGFLQMVPEYVKPIAYDATKLGRHVGEFEMTNYRDALAQTIQWLKRSV